LVADFKAAKAAADWPKAAESLNGLDSAGIATQVGGLSHAERMDLYRGAIAAMSGVSRDRVNGAIAAADLPAAYDAAMRPPQEWAKAAEHLNGFNDADINARIAALSPADRTSLRQACPEWAHRVRGPLLVAEFGTAKAAGEWAKAAELLN